MVRPTAVHQLKTLVWLIGALVPTALAGNIALAGSATGSVPAPTAMDAPQVIQGGPTAVFTIGAPTVRLTGSHKLFKIDSSGRILSARRVDLGVAVYGAREEVASFSGKQFVRISSGPYAGLFVVAPNFAPAAVERLPASTTVALRTGRYAGVRFYADGSVRTRRPVDLATATTFGVSQRARFGTRTHFFVTTGPLAGRWLAESRATALTVEQAPQTTPAPTPTATPRPTPIATPTPSPTPLAEPVTTWRGAVLVYRQTDVTFTRANGTDYHLQAQMSDRMHGLLLDTVDRFRAAVTTWSGGLARMELDIIEVPHALTGLDQFGDGYWVGPRAVEADMDRYAPTGKYDSVFVIWQPKDSAGVTVPVNGWGLTVPAGSWSNGAGFTSITTPAQLWWWTSVDDPQEVFIHEWMHQVVYWNEKSGDFDFDLHAGADFGYSATSGGSWKPWLQDVMQGQVVDHGARTGISPAMWAAGTPTGI